jgi:putative tricarboxylic transport membrane protein
MRFWDLWASFLGIGLGAFVVIFSLQMNLGFWNRPGPGMFPLISGILLIALCIVYSAQSAWAKDADYINKQSPWPRKNRLRLIGVVSSLLIYSFTLDTLGFLIATFFLMVFLFRMLEAKGILWPVIEAALAVLVTYMVFYKLLMVQFPKGFIGV